MNDDIDRGLRILVERAVRPVVATRTRKRAMRAELLAHVNGVFDDEYASLGDEATALRRTQERFGVARELTGQLQRTVPWWNRATVPMERLDWVEGESVWKLAGRHVVVSLLSFAVVFLAIVPTVYFRGRDTFDFAWRVSVVQGILVGPFSFFMFVIATKLAETLFGTAGKRSWPKAVIYLTCSALLFPAFAFCVYLGLTSEMRSSVRHLLFACWFLPALPILFVAVARLLHKERSYERSWSQLDVSE